MGGAYPGGYTKKRAGSVFRVGDYFYRPGFGGNLACC